MNRVISELHSRKSVRAYLNKEIEPQKKQQILDASIQAPSAGNMALYSIIDVTDQALKDSLSETCDNQPFIAKAPLVLVFCADYKRWYDVFCEYEEEVRKPGIGDFILACEDAVIAAQNAVVAAESMGIGSCYIGDIIERYETHQDLFKLPEYVAPIAMVVFGYPTQQQKEREKPVRFQTDQLVFENHYVQTSPEAYMRMLEQRQDKKGSEMISWVKAFCHRKWNSDFSMEMSRSVQVMIDSWLKQTR